MRRSKKMRERVLALMLLVTMVFTMLPTTIYGNEGGILSEIQEQIEEEAATDETKEAATDEKEEAATDEKEEAATDETKEAATDEKEEATTEQKEESVTEETDKTLTLCLNQEESDAYLASLIPSEGNMTEEQEAILVAHLAICVLCQAAFPTATPMDSRAGSGAITVKVNDDNTEYSGDNLNAAVQAAGNSPVEKITVTAGTIVADDWNSVYEFRDLTHFTVEDAVTSVANIADNLSESPVFFGFIQEVNVANITEIGKNAFNCMNQLRYDLASVTFPDVTTIDDYAFSSCRLTTATFPKLETVGEGAFHYGEMTSVDFPELTTIGISAFSNTKLESIDFPKVTKIGETGFSGCTNLTSANLPKLETIDSQAFGSCSKLTTLELPATPPNVTNTNAFNGCPASRSLVFVDADGTPLEDTALQNAITAYKNHAGYNPDSNLWYGWKIEPDKITVKVNDSDIKYGGIDLKTAVGAAIGENLTDLTGVTKITVTAGEIVADDWKSAKFREAFTALTHFTVEDTEAVTAVANMPDMESLPAFPETIKEVNVAKITALSNMAFRNRTNLTSATFPAVVEISNQLFDGCTALTSVTFPVATNVNNKAFIGCTALKSVTFPAATDIADNAFEGCSSLVTLGLPATPTTAVANANAFTGCPGNRKLMFVGTDGTPLEGEALAAPIAAYAGVNDGENSASDNLWYGWKIKADKITIKVGNNPEEYGGDNLNAAISAAWQAGNDYIGKVTVIAGEIVAEDWNSLHDFTELTNFIVEDTVTAVADMVNTSSTTGPAVFNDAIEIVDVAKVTKIGKNAFNNLNAEDYNLARVEFPDVTEIGEGAFSNQSMGSAKFPKLEKVGKNAFSGCTGLASVDFPKLTTIDENAFSGCWQLTSVTFPNLITIGENAFSGCARLATLGLSATLPTVTNENAFTDCPENRKLVFVNEDGTPLEGEALTPVIAAYKDVEDGDTTDNLWYGWKIKADAITVKVNNSETEYGGSSLKAAVDAAVEAEASIADLAGVTKITVTAGEIVEADWKTDNFKNAFTGLTHFTVEDAVTAVANIANESNLVFPTTIQEVNVVKVTTIDKSAFFQCSNLESINFPDVTTIGDTAFYQCTKLTGVNFLKAQSIGLGAFEGCGELLNATFPNVENINEQAFMDCKKLAELKLPAASPAVVNASAFNFCPENRKLVFVNEDGTPLADAANAITTYKGVNDGSNSVGDNLWFGWIIESDNITVKVNNSETEYGGSSLKAAVDAAVEAEASIADLAGVTKITVTKGKIVEADWKTDNFKNAFTGLTHFTVEDNDAVTAVAMIASEQFGSPVFPATIEDVDIAKVKTIGQSAFEGSTVLKSINFPSLEKIGWYVFKDCTALTKVNLPALNAPSYKMFAGCTALTSITLPVKGIDPYAFEGCTGLTSATFPNVTLIQDSAFNNCTSLKKLYLPDAIPRTDGKTAFTGCPDDRTIYLSSTKAVATYKAHDDGNKNDDLWYGWKLKSEQSPVTTVLLTVNGSNATATGAGRYAPGTVVSIDAGAVNGSTFKGWTSNNGGVFADTTKTVTTFIMPTTDTTVTANWKKKDDPVPPSGGGGSSSSGGGGGGGSTTPSQKPTENVSGSADSKATVDEKGNASATVSDKNINDAITAAKAEATKNNANAGEISVVINVKSDATDTNTVTVNLPLQTQKIALDNKVNTVSLMIEKPDISISMDLASITEINKQAKADVQLTATRMDNSVLSSEAKAAIGARPAFDLKASYAQGASFVTDFGDGTVNIAIPYIMQDSEKADELCAVYVDDNGKVNYIEDSSYDEEAALMRFDTNHFSVYGIGYKKADRFTDIGGHWAENDINTVADAGLMSGVEDTLFAPDRAMTRGMFVTVLGRLAKADTANYTTSTFTDVKADEYYAPYINWATAKGIVSGMSATSFEPERSISRQEMALIMSKFITAMNYNIPGNIEAVTFADDAMIADWAAFSVKQMQMAGILSGKNGNLFDPTGTATRSEIASLLNRFSQMIQ